MPNVTGTPVSTASALRRSQYSWMRAGSRPVSSPAISNTPALSSPSTPTRLRTSSQSANRLATGCPSGVWWLRVRDVVKPAAPARMAPRTSRCMAARSSGVASSVNARSPMT